MIPSDAVGAPYTWGTPPAARTPSHPLRASRSRWALHGVISLNSDATPTTGLSKSASVNPTARSIARFGARPGPPVVVRLFRVVPVVSAMVAPRRQHTRHSRRTRPDRRTRHGRNPHPSRRGCYARPAVRRPQLGGWEVRVGPV